MEDQVYARTHRACECGHSGGAYCKYGKLPESKPSYQNGLMSTGPAILGPAFCVLIVGRFCINILAYF